MPRQGQFQGQSSKIGDRRLLPPAVVVQKVAGERLAPVFEHAVTAEQKLADLKKQIDANRGLSTSLTVD